MNKCHVCVDDAMLKIFRFPIFYVYLCLTMPHATRRLKYCLSISLTSIDRDISIILWDCWTIFDIYSWIKSFFISFSSFCLFNSKIKWMAFLQHIIRMFALIDLYLPFLSCIGQTIQIESFIIGKNRKLWGKNSIQYAILQSI